LGKLSLVAHHEQKAAAFEYGIPVEWRRRADDTLGNFGNLGLRNPVTSARADSVRSAFLFAYRIVGGFHQEDEPFIDQPVHDMYHLGVLAFDLVFRKQSRPVGSSRRKWRLH
jgi:hypothetical protein